MLPLLADLVLAAAPAAAPVASATPAEDPPFLTTVDDPTRRAARGTRVDVEVAR